MAEPQTASDLMMHNRDQAQRARENQNTFRIQDEPEMVLPNAEVQRFLLDILQQASFPGRISEFVSHVKQLVQSARLRSP
jgi:hypothetical protein